MDDWRIPYELWLRIAPLIPPPEKRHRFGAVGREYRIIER